LLLPLLLPTVEVEAPTRKLVMNRDRNMFAFRGMWENWRRKSCL
jgi:hypothetical protein